jgi:hypothetical protein
MSGRSGYTKSNHPLLGRKAVRRPNRRRPDQMPDWRLTFPAPPLVSPGPTGVIGVSVVDPGPTIEARGRNYKWVLGQVATFLGRISVDSYIADAILDRDKPVRRTLRYDNGTLTLRRRPKTAARA